MSSSINIPTAKHVGEGGTMQIPAGQHDLGRVDHMNQGYFLHRKIQIVD